MAITAARAMKPGLLALADRVLAWYVPAVLTFAGLAVFLALAVLVMGYPCALGMATPLAMIRGGGEAARKGILMRSAEAFQVMKDIRYAVFDKTGTLTRGKPEVTHVLLLTPTSPAPLSLSQEERGKGVADRQGGGSEGAILALAASAERFSEHPLARAIVEAARERGIPLAEPQDFQAFPGRGVRARVEGREVLVGSPSFLKEHGVDIAPLREKLEALQKSGHTVVVVAADGVALGPLPIRDALKPDAHETVSRLRALGIEPIMLTGDSARTAHAVAAEVGIERVFAGVLPGEKAEVLRHLQRDGTRLAMVGDGINDAPALTQADLGIAIGAGSDIAIESADVVLTGGRLSAVVETLHIGRRAYRKTVQNLILAFAFNGIGVPLAVTGIVPPVWAMIAMVASVSAVLLNSLGEQLMPGVISSQKGQTTNG